MRIAAYIMAGLLAVCAASADQYRIASGDTLHNWDPTERMPYSLWTSCVYWATCNQDPARFETWTVPDFSAQRHDGSQTNIPRRPAIESKTLRFDGTNDFAYANNICTNSFFGQPFTMAIWGKLLAKWGSWQCYCSAGNLASSGWYVDFVLDPATKLRCETAGAGGANSAITSATFTNDTGWHHLVGVLDTDGKVTAFYVDGTNAASATANVNDLSSMNLFYMGQVPYTGYTDLDPFSGYLDDCMVFDRNLSALEVTNLYNSTRFKVRP